MPVYADTYLPTVKELTVEELNLSSPALRAGAFHVGKYCDQQSKEFMLCRQELKDPRCCVPEGKEVTSCALEFFRKMKQHCRDEFEQYAKCLDYSSYDMKYSKCRKTQAVYDQCVLDNLDLERPPLGYFSRPRLHDTNRPKPELDPPKVYEDATPALPQDYPQEKAVHGSRFFFYNS